MAQGAPDKEKTFTARNTSLDVLRLLACVLVILVHVSSESIYTYALSSADWYISHLCNSLGILGPVLFMMLSGALLLAPSYDFSYRRFYGNNFLTLLICYICWVVLYHLIGFFTRGNYGWIYFKDVIIGSIKGEAGYHFWYLPMLLGIYLLLPFLRAIIAAERKLTVYFLALFFVVEIAFTTVSFFTFPHKYLVESLMERIPFTLINHYAGYFVLGYFLADWIKTTKVSARKRILGSAILCGLGLGLGLALDTYLSVGASANSVDMNNIFSLTSFVCAGAVFILVLSLPMAFSEQTKGLLKKLSALCFGIFMMHPLLWDAMSDAGFLGSLPVFLRILFRTLLLLLSCGVLTWILSKIPFVKKYLCFIAK